MHKDLVSLQSKGSKSGKEEPSLTTTTTTTSDSPVFPSLELLEEDAVQESNIAAMLSPASTLAEARQSIQLIQHYTEKNNNDSNAAAIQLKTTVGVHPYHVNDNTVDTAQDQYTHWKDLAESNRDIVTAIGECGLDYSDGFPPRDDQLPWFRQQVLLARELRMPLFVHERLAHDDVLSILDEILGHDDDDDDNNNNDNDGTTTTTASSSSSSIPVLIHCFTGTVADCRRYIERGYYISISGFVQKKETAAEVQRCLAERIIPLDRLMVETDAPYMGFAGCRQLYVDKYADTFVASLNSKKKKRLVNSTYPNVPSALPLVLDKVVECLNEQVGTDDSSCSEHPVWTKEQVAEATTRNAAKFFGFDVQV